MWGCVGVTGRYIGGNTHHPKARWCLGGTTSGEAAGARAVAQGRDSSVLLSGARSFAAAQDDRGRRLRVMLIRADKSAVGAINRPLRSPGMMEMCGGDGPVNRRWAR